MTVWNSALREHNHGLHAYVAALPAEEAVAAADAYMAAHQSERLPVDVTRCDTYPGGNHPAVTTWEVWDRRDGLAVQVAVCTTEWEADALCVSLQPHCEYCAVYRRLMEGA